MATRLTKKILIVDDAEENRMILADICSTIGYEAMEAENGKIGMEMLRNHHVDCVLLDIKMPVMNGIEMLSILKRDNIIGSIPVIMVTGVEDTKSVVDALNMGAADYITKPFEAKILMARLKGVLKRYEIFLNEKDLVEKTFFGSVRLLNDLLSTLSPHIFGKSNQIRRIAKALCKEIHFPDSNEVELAALFSHVGCISLSSEITEKLVTGKFLLSEEKQIFDNHPLLGYKLLKNIPLLEHVANTVLYQNKNYDGSGTPISEKIAGEEIPLPARILRVAIEYQSARIKSNSTLELSDLLRSRSGLLDPNLYKALSQVMIKEDSRELREIKILQLRTGMIFADDIFTTTNNKIASQWQEATDGLVERITNIHYQIGVKEPIKVFSV